MDMPSALEYAGPSGVALAPAGEQEQPVEDPLIAKSFNVSAQDARAAEEPEGGGEVNLVPQEEAVPIAKMPALIPRMPDYWGEPLCGICFVGGACCFFVAMVTGLGRATAVKGGSGMLTLCVIGIWAEALCAAFCVLYILLAQAGMVRRTPERCYPIPAPVENILRRTGSRTGLQNFANVTGPRNLGTYCVRCLVWRKKEGGVVGEPHHCSTCQRCVEGFDHHCGVFGRCIVAGNMPCFNMLLGLFPMAFLTLILAVASSEPPKAPHHNL